MTAGPLRHPALCALVAQAASALLLFAVLAALYQGLGWRVPLWLVALLQGMLAAWLGRRMGLSRWWLPINVLFVPALLLAYALALPAWAWALGFIVVLLLNWNSVGDRVPLYLTGAGSERALKTLLAERGSGFTFIDLGCGLAGTLTRLARAYPEARFVGVETAPLSFVVAWVRALPRRNCRVRYRNLWSVGLQEYDVVYCFLSPAPMPSLWRKARAEMRDGAWLVSNSFGVPGVEPQRLVEVDDWRHSRLLVWHPQAAAGAD